MPPVWLFSDWRQEKTNLSERLSHLPQEVLGELDGFVHSEIQTAVADVLLNPAGKFPTFVCSGITLWTGHTPVTKTPNSYLSGVTSTKTSWLVFQSDQTNMGVEQVEAKNWFREGKNQNSPCQQRSWVHSQFSLWWLGPRTGQRAAWHQTSGSRSPWSGSDPGGTPDEPETCVRREYRVENEGGAFRGSCEWFYPHLQRMFSPWGCDSECKHKALRTWWLLGRNGELNRTGVMIMFNNSPTNKQTNKHVFFGKKYYFSLWTFFYSLTY